MLLRSYFPDRRPPARGLQTSRPTFSDLEHRHDLALEIAAGQRVVGLQRADRSELAARRDALCLRDVPRRPVRDADIAHEALAHDRIEGVERLLDRRDAIEAVDLVEVDVFELQALQARLHLREDVDARRAAAVRTLRHAAEHLRRDDDVIPRDAEIAESLPGDRLREAGGIDVRGVDEVDAGIESRAQQAVDLLLLQRSDLLPHAFAAAEGHGAEAEFGDEQAGLAEDVVAHEGELS